MKRQVVFIDETAQVGGAEINLLTVASRLQGKGWDPCVVLPGKGPFSDLLSDAGIPVRIVSVPSFASTSFQLTAQRKLPNPLALALNAWRGALWSVKLTGLLRASDASVVHTISMWSHAFGGLAGRRAGRPVVWHFQDIVSRVSGFGLYRKLLILWARRVPDRIVCISGKVADQFVADELNGDKISLLWNSVDIERFRPAVPSDRRTDCWKGITIGTCGRLIPWKGHVTALAAAHRLRLLGIPFRWLVAGDERLGSAHYRAQLQGLVRRWDLDGCVEFVGWVPDIPAFYRTLDVLVHLPLEPEPYGLVLAEAMASGLPIITTRGGGMESLVEEAGGFLVAPGQSEAVAELLTWLWRSPAERIRAGEMARLYAEKAFSLDRYVEQLAGIYRTLAGGI